MRKIIASVVPTGEHDISDNVLNPVTLEEIAHDLICHFFQK